ncbi:MAG: homoserine dehydrogenase [Candidatus Omnitrophota bacterium]
MNSVNVGLIGFGTIGSGVVKVFKKRSLAIAKKLGIKLNLKYVCDQDISSDRGVTVNPKVLVTDVNKILEDDDIKIVVELIGGIHPAKEFILKALNNKKYVVTANKALLAENGEEIFKAAEKNNVDVYFEASVGGGIPIIKSLREGLVASQVQNIFGIINGTSNYILSQMSLKGCDFKTALREAQSKGYAEKDPKLDINGMDSAHKIAILARICFNYKVSFKDIYVEGIEEISLSDIKYADELGYCVKLLAIAKKSGEKVEIRVHPTLLPKKHLLSNVNGVFNAIFINSDLVGEMLFYGPGAGQMPTASAVMSDIVEIAQKITNPQAVNLLAIKNGQRSSRMCSIDNIETRYYLRFLALDEPGVLSKVSEILGKQKISIYNVIQKGRRQAQAVPIVMMVHEAKEKNLRKALSQIDKLPIIKRKTVAIRVERG